MGPIAPGSPASFQLIAVVPAGQWAPVRTVSTLLVRLTQPWIVFGPDPGAADAMATPVPRSKIAAIARIAPGSRHTRRHRASAPLIMSVGLIIVVSLSLTLS
jgi:hypothetical protein